MLEHKVGGPEQELPGQNSFLLFLNENQPLVNSLVEVYQDFKVEQDGWKPIYQTLLEDSAKFIVDNTPHRPETEERFRQWYIRNNMISTFGIGVNSELIRNRRQMRQNAEDEPLNKTPEGQVLMTRMFDFNDDYIEAVDPILTIYYQRKRDVREAIYFHLISDIAHVRGFGDFLESDAFRTERQRYQILLRAIAESEILGDSKNRLTDAVENAMVKREKETPTLDIFSSFLAEKSKKAGQQWSWIAFAARLNGISLEDPNDQNLQEAARLFIENFPIPEDLRNDYAQHSLRLIRDAFHQVKRGLSRFSPKTERLSAESPLAQNRRAAREDARAGRHSPVTGINYITEYLDEASEEPQIPYSIAILKDGQYGYSALVLDEASRKDYAVDVAGGLAKGDQRIVRDIEIILAELRSNPYGYGIKKVSDGEIGIGAKSLSLRRLAPDKRPGLRYEHELTRDIRVVFAIDSGTRQVVIEGIYPHPEFDKRFP